MMLDKNFKDFLQELASSAPVPGGGGASAAVGALGMALGAMVANLTTGKKKYAQYQEDIERIIDEAEILMEELCLMADEDAKAFEPLAAAYSLPKETEEEKAHKAAVMEKALYEASVAPLRIMEKIMDSILLLDEVSKKGSVMAISDAGAGALFAGAALKAASLNVFINTKSMTDRQVAMELNTSAYAMIEKGTGIADDIYARVMERLTGGNS